MNKDSEKNINIIKFALVGPQSVGKTTILNVLKERFQGNEKISFVDEGARIFFDSNPHIVKRDAGVQAQIQDFVLNKEKASYTEETEVIIADRSVVDPVVLALIWDTEENAKKLHENISNWLSTYYLFFLLSPEGVPSAADPNRKETDEERHLIHNLFISYFNTHNLNYIKISGSLEKRISQIEMIITQFFIDGIQ